MAGGAPSGRHSVHHDHAGPLMPVEDAQRMVLEQVRPLPPERRLLPEAHGCVTVEDVRAPADLPRFDSSAMDGYAVRAEDVAAAAVDRPVPLAVAGRVTVGRAADVAVGAGETVAVPTGGPIPEGADAVVPVEATVEEDGRVLVLEPSPLGTYVRPAGEDVRAGEVLVPAGRRLLGPDLGLLAAAGLAEASVRPPARVLVVSTGDELVAPGEEAAPGQVHDANAFTLAGSIREAGAVPVAAGIVRDDPTALLDVLATNLDRADVLVSSGGVSVGERDPVKLAFAGRGEVRFLEVAMQPGKPQAFGVVEGRPFFGLPGNPVSVFVSFEVFVRPALMTMMGRPPHRPEVTATLEGDVSGPREKAQFARVRLRREDAGWRAAPTGGARSNLMATVSRANALAVIPVGVDTVRAGEEVRVIPFRDPEQP
jgi:molybdopterin molybdotransferase